MTPTDRPPILDPDCEGQKHRACFGQALDPITDEIVACECPCHEPDATREAAIADFEADGYTRPEAEALAAGGPIGGAAA